MRASRAVRCSLVDKLDNVTPSRMCVRRGGPRRGKIGVGEGRSEPDETAGRTREFRDDIKHRVFTIADRYIEPASRRRRRQQRLDRGNKYSVEQCK